MKPSLQLAEIPHARQIPGEAPRRWFYSSDMDLIVWLDTAGDPLGFQLCYDKDGQEKALTWWPDSGARHMQVDDGEGHAGRHKATPLLLPDGKWDAPGLRQLFAHAATQLPPEIRTFIASRL